MRGRDLISIADLSALELTRVLDTAMALKDAGRQPLLAGKTLALVFEKPSLRTRVSFETGMMQLGGHTVFLGPDEIRLGVRESVADCARVLSRWVDLIVVRTFSQATLEEMAAHATAPIINGLTDLYHPCQVLADCLTLLEHKGKLDGLKIAFIGDGNNMAHSWMEAAEKLPLTVAAACPKGYEPNADVVRGVKANGARIVVTRDVAEAARGADVLYTDVWASMGQESEAESRRRVFQGYQINRDVLALAKKDAVVMHCLPAHRGEEITDEALEGPQSIVFDQAENRLHAQKAIMLWLVKGFKG